MAQFCGIRWGPLPMSFGVPDSYENDVKDGFCESGGVLRLSEADFVTVDKAASSRPHSKSAESIRVYLRSFAACFVSVFAFLREARASGESKRAGWLACPDKVRNGALQTE